MKLDPQKTADIAYDEWAYGIQAQHDCNDCHGTGVPSPPSPKKT